MTKPRVDPASLPATYQFKDLSIWGWEEIRDYAIFHMTMLSGEFSGHPTSASAEKSIFVSFAKRHGEMAAPIVKYAFTILKGLWYDEPIDIFRFCKNSDPYFADPIKNLIEQAK